MPTPDFYGFTREDVVRVLFQRAWLVVAGVAVAAVTVLMVANLEVEPRYAGVLEVLARPRPPADPLLREHLPRAEIAEALGGQALSLQSRETLERVAADLPPGPREELAATFRAEVLPGYRVRFVCEQAVAARAREALRGVLGEYRAACRAWEAARGGEIAALLRAEAEERGRRRSLAQKRRAAVAAGLALPETPLEKAPASVEEAAARLAARREAIAAEESRLRDRLAALATEIDALRVKLDDPEQTTLRREEVLQVPTDARRRLERQKRLLAEELAAKLRHATERHPHVRELRERIALVEAKIDAAGTEEKVVVHTRPNPAAETWRAERAAKQRRRTELQRRLDDLAAAAEGVRALRRRLPAARQQAAALAAEAAELRAAQSRLTEAAAALAEAPAEGLRWAAVSVQAPPRTTPLHDRPSAETLLGYILVLGLGAAAVLVALAEYTDNTVKGVNDVRRHFDAPVLAAVPEFGLEASVPAERLRELWQRLRRRPAAEPAVPRTSQQVVMRRGVRARWIVGLVLLIAALVLGILLAADVGGLRAWFGDAGDRPAPAAGSETEPADASGADATAPGPAADPAPQNAPATAPETAPSPEETTE